MIASGNAPRTQFHSHIQMKGTDGKRQFKPYKEGGRTYNKPLQKRAMGGHYSPTSGKYGYRTNYKFDHIRQSPSRARAGHVIRGLGRASLVIGVAGVLYNINRHGAKEAARQEGKFWVHDVPLGTMGGVTYLDNQFLGGTLHDTGRSSQIAATTLLTQAIMAVV